MKQSPAFTEKAPQSPPSQTVKALLSLRDLILKGALAPGERLSELVIVERLGVSRTPLRAALIRLEEEGLIEALPTGGFTVRAFTERDIYDAIELRGTLEGLAARLAAERGAQPEKLDALKSCVADIDALLENNDMSADLMSAYVGMNGAFHTLIAELPESPGVVRQIERVISLPFASASAFVMAQVGLPQARAVLTLAQEHHKGVIEAIEARQGARAESLMREHARLAHRNLQFVLHDKEWLERIPGGALIERSGQETKAPKGKRLAP
jgi:GntR family transcriptional regulator, vanillate catabolism transcriptional regulator